MGLQKEVVVDLIEIVQSSSVQVRTATRIVEDGEVISQSFHRHVVGPTDDYSGETPLVQAVCALVFGPPA